MYYNLFLCLFSTRNRQIWLFFAKFFNVTRDDVTRDVFPKFNGKGYKEPII